VFIDETTFLGEFMAGEVKNFMGYLWYQVEDGVYTIGINEDGLADFDEVVSVELPSEEESIQEDVVLGTIETNDGPLDIYSPVSGKILEVNSNVLEDPNVIMEDPYEEGWLVRVDTSEDDEDLEEDEDEDDFEEDEEEEDED